LNVSANNLSTLRKGVEAHARTSATYLGARADVGYINGLSSMSESDGLVSSWRPRSSFLMCHGVRLKTTELGLGNGSSAITGTAKIEFPSNAGVKFSVPEDSGVSSPASAVDCEQSQGKRGRFPKGILITGRDGSTRAES
jgi:hypothetical protein